MLQFSAETITSLLSEQCRNIIVGYSGGVDSHVLLHVCASHEVLKPKIVAVYIHHGLQNEADFWEKHCEIECRKLGVNFKSITVNAAAGPGESPESAARDARYSAFKQLLAAGDVLLLAQHREDQMETVLLQLFRGGGLHGLSGMPVFMPFGQGSVMRPFLGASKQDILSYARRHDLQWVDDPSNLSCDYDRNYLRNCVVPLLKQRWPSVDKTVARAAGHCGSAARLLDDWSLNALAEIVDFDDHSLSIDEWEKYNERQRAWLLRQWLKLGRLKAPSQAILQAIVGQVIYAKIGADAEVRIQGHRVKKHRHRLYRLAESFFRPETDSRVWDSREDVMILQNGYRLTRREASSGIDQSLWKAQRVTVEPRRGGEKIKLFGRQGHHCLKKLYQEAGIAPWEREVRPLIYLNGRLAAVADLWVAEWAAGVGDCYRLSWNRDTVSETGLI